MKVYLSPRRLSLYMECKRCFFDETFLRIKRPRGPYPTLPGAIDEAMKTYCDKFRADGTLPEQLHKSLDGFQLMADQRAVDRLRHWKQGLQFTIDREIEYEGGKTVTHEYIVQGALDELIFDPDTDSFVVPDFKTRKDEPKPDYSKRYYQTTMDTYDYLLENAGLESSHRAVLWYMWPQDVQTSGPDQLILKFGCCMQELETDPKLIAETVEKIIQMTPKDSILEKHYKPLRPNWNPDCEYCNYKRS